MASKKSAKNKHYPVVRIMNLSSASPYVPNQVDLVDVGRCLSQVNRRLYRYGRYYNVKIDLEPDASSQIEVYTLRDDWAVQKGFQMAYAAYLKNSQDERAMMGKNQIARWEDFRCTPGIAGNDMGPALFLGATAVELVLQGEFTPSEVIDENDANRTFTWGPTTDATQYSVLGEYDKAGNAQSSPSSFVAGNSVPYEELTDEVDGLMANNLEAFGDNPPYDRDGVNANGPFVRIATLKGDTANAQKLSTGFFTAPCGLVWIRKTSSAVNLSLGYSLTVKAGDYKGVDAPSMLE